MYHFGSGSCLTGADLTDLERIAKVPQQHSRRTTENKNIGNIGEYHVYYIQRLRNDIPGLAKPLPVRQL